MAAGIPADIAADTPADVTADGVCVTPHEFLLPGHGPRARTGVLLVHGMTGTPNEMRLLGRGLNKEGFTVYAVQLAGHCGTVDDLLATRWQDWLATVQGGADRLRRQEEGRAGRAGGARSRRRARSCERGAR